MTTEQRFVTQTESAMSKLQSLYDTMPPAEQKIVETLLQLVSEGQDVQEFAVPCCGLHIALPRNMGLTSPVTLPQMTFPAPH